ncbi:acyl-coenzyme A diphosphatase NUDT19 [Lepeophtheirus salmonis]|uniref:acyl-coenzyme A diphosphatase NUDT19 n=1 Tax=Lepeophtheirus salmonis TaxID=72036 RepID=UPI003AF3C8F2
MIYMLYSVIIDPSTADRPFLISNVECSSHLHRDIGFRLTALRETFEETGVLLFKSLHSQPLDVSSFTDWRIKIKENPGLFMKMCHEMEIAPDIWSLYEWSSWLTPLGLKAKGGRRFDTIFYMAFTDKESHSHVKGDENEIFSVEWSSPDSILFDREEKEYYVGPPQLWETAKLLNFRTLTSLQEFCLKRSKRGCRSLFPVLARLPKEQGYFSFLPGDDYYPEEVNPRQPEEEYEIYDVDEDYKEVMRYTRCRNRIYMSLDRQFSLPFSNVKDPHGHVKPVEYMDFMIK